MKTALYQGVGRIIRGVFSRGRAFLPQTERSPKLLRGEGGGINPHDLRILGGSIPPRLWMGGAGHRLPHTREHSRVGKGCQAGGERGRHPSTAGTPYLAQAVP